MSRYTASSRLVSWYRRNLAPLHPEAARRAASLVMIWMFFTMSTWISLAYLQSGSLTLMMDREMGPVGTVFVVVGMPGALLASAVLMRRSALPSHAYGLPFVIFFVCVGIGGALSGQVNGAGSQAPNVLAAVYAAYQLPRFGAWAASGICVTSTVINNVLLAPNAAGVVNVVLVAASFAATTAVVIHLRARQEQLRAELQRRLDVDSLTGVGTRRVLEASLEELGADGRLGPGTALLLVDLDHLKRVNDTHGHAAGDRLIQHVCRLLKAGAPATATVCRIGGDELAVLIPGVDERQAQEVARGLLDSIGADPVSLPGDVHVTAGASLGLGHVSEASALSELYHRADGALYLAKHDGRDRLCLPGGEVFRPRSSRQASA